MGYVAQPTFSDNAVDQLSKAKILYDKGQYVDALSAAERAYELDSENEIIAVVLSSIHMALAGIDTFQLVQRMILNNEGENLIASDAAGNLTSLSSLVGVSTNELDLLTLENNEKNGVQGAPESGLFKDLPVLLPKSAPDARLTGGDTVFHIHKAITVLCPFVEEAVKITEGSGDIRHRRDVCEPLGQHKYRGKSHFNWAFAHLTEALLFHTIVLYAPSGDQPNLQMRGAILDDSNQVQDLEQYISALNELAVVTDIILPTSAEESENSMLLAMFNDLDAASRAFASLSGIPESITSGIISSLQDLKSQRSQIERPESSQNSSSQALKSQLTAKLAKEIREQVTTRFETENLNESEKQDICAAYNSISTEAFTQCEGL